MIIDDDFAWDPLYGRPWADVALPDEPESRLIERLVARDERAFNELVRAYERRVLTLVIRMLGNAAEWCADFLDENYYVNSPPQNPTGPSTGTRHILRGEGWFSKPLDCRPSRRLDGTTGHADATTGFRVVCEP